MMPHFKHMMFVALLLAAVSAWAGPLTIARVWPEKLFYHPGETAAIAVDVKNGGDAAQAVSVQLFIRWGIDGSTELPQQALTVPAKGQASATFRYLVPKGHKWGHEALATVKVGETFPPLEAREYFAVGENAWEVGHYLTCFSIRGNKQSGYADARMKGARENYVTTWEAFYWMPTCFNGMAPAQAEWRSGWGGYKESKEDWIYWIQQAHKQGQAVITSAYAGAAGPVGMDFVRQHPDWLTYDKTGRTSAFFDIDKLETMRTDPDKSSFGDSSVFYVGNHLPINPQIGDAWIDNMIESTAMFGWDGFRSDGHPVVVEGYDYTGTLRSARDLGAANAEFLLKFRHKLRARFPNFLFGWNWAAGNIPAQDPVSKVHRDALFTDSAYLLFEYFNSTSNPSSPYHTWKKLVPYLQQEVDAVRAYNSFSHCGWMPSLRYLEAVVSASGSRVDTWKAPLDYRRFEFAHSEFIWDNYLKFVRPGESAVTVDGAVWWKDFVHTRTLPNGHQRVVVHLINMPEKDDDAWADKAPAPVENVKVTFKPVNGKAPKKVLVLSPDTPNFVIPLKPNADGSVTVPAVTVWTVVVADY